MAIYGPIQANTAIRNRHWQSPGRHHKKLPNSPANPTRTSPYLRGAAAVAVAAAAAKAPGERAVVGIDAGTPYAVRSMVGAQGGRVRREAARGGATGPPTCSVGRRVEC